MDARELLEQKDFVPPEVKDIEITDAAINRLLQVGYKQVEFSVFKNAAENALYKICKNFKPKSKNLKYLVTDSNGKILKILAI